MTLKIHSEEDSERQLQVTVEVPEERVQAQMRITARSLAKQVRIPGFRKGKVPYNVLKNRLGEQALRADAIEDMIEPVFLEAIEQIGEQPFRQPTLENIEMDPLVLKLVVPLEPTVVLGEYRAIRKELKDVEVAAEALEEALEQLRISFQELEEVERAAEVGDMVTVTGQGKTSGESEEVFWEEKEYDLLLDPERTFPDLPFVENIAGTSAGEETEFNVSFPDDYEDEELAGKEAVFQISVIKVQNRTLPDLDDELAKQAGEYETLEELRTALEEQLLEQAKRSARDSLLDEWVDELKAEAKIVFPPAVVESELDTMVDAFKDQITRSGWQWEDFLKLQGETEKTLRENWREGAANRIQRGLVMRGFSEQEQLKVEGSDVDEMLNRRIGQYGEDAELQEQVRNVLSQGPGLESIRNDILMEKIIARIEAIVTGNAPDLEAPGDSEEEAMDEEE